jgi:3-phenylpropionate/cinnamic acid dioxygenase small subunit
VQVYRVIQLWTIDQQTLKDQIDKILSGAAAAEPAPTPEKQKAIDLVQQSFFDGF